MEGVGVVTTSPEGHQRMLRRLKEVRKVLRKSNAASPGADQALGEEEGVGWPLVLLGVSEGVAFVMLEDDAVGDAVGVAVVCVLLVSDIGFTGGSRLTNDSLTCHPVVRREGVGRREESNVSNTDNVSPLACTRVRFDQGGETPSGDLPFGMTISSSLKVHVLCRG